MSHIQVSYTKNNNNEMNKDGEADRENRIQQNQINLTVFGMNNNHTDRGEGRNCFSDFEHRILTI